MARSQYWTTVLKRTRLLNAPDINRTGNNRPWKRPVVGVHPHLPGLYTLNQYTTWLAALTKDGPGSGSLSKLISGLIVAGTVNIWCTKQSGPFRYCFQHENFPNYSVFPKQKMQINWSTLNLNYNIMFYLWNTGLYYIHHAWILSQQLHEVQWQEHPCCPKLLNRTKCEVVNQTNYTQVRNYSSVLLM